MGPQKKRITQADFFRLCTWLSNNQELLIQDAPAQSEIAQRASKDIGKELNADAVRRGIEATGVKYSPKSLSGRRNNKTLREEMNVMQSHLTQNAADIAWLSGVVREMAASLGFAIKGDPQHTQNIRLAK